MTEQKRSAVIPRVAQKWMPKMVCSECDSDNIKKLSLVFEGGVMFVDTKTRGVGLGFGRGGMGVGVGGGRTTGTQTTALSAKAQPPKKKKWGVFAAVGIVMLLLVGASYWCLLGVLLCAALVVTAIRYNRTVWPVLWSRWDAAYMCDRCGAIGAPRRNAPTIVSSPPLAELPEPTRSAIPID